MEAEEYVERIRLCLFEVGYRDVALRHIGWLENGLPSFGTTEPIPVALAYMAARLSVIRDHPDVTQSCYGCFKASYLHQQHETSVRCREGDCLTGGPAWPSQEELLGADRTEGLEIHAHVA